ncbi:MAG: GntR family transcriptional regulator [Clostridiales bacterium]|jgi:DNA-binding transcriptional regulator YhcF (GntR family)|nr:GntR family transcriptional regulator [Clostridiales bacterium]
MLLELDFTDETPIYMQIRNQIVMGIADGKLSPGEKLPTIRALSNEAGINMMTVNKAYALLKQEGFIQTDRRSGVAVSGSVPSGGVTEKLKSGFKLLVSEAKLCGMTKQEILNLCGEFFETEN